MCRTLAANGYRLGVGFRGDGERAAGLAAELSGGGHLPLALPVTDSAALHAAAARVEDEIGACDVVVNCAGTTRYVPHGDLDALDDSLIDEILATNVRGPIATVRAFLPLLRRSGHPGGAVVVNISSIAAVTATGSNVVYCASKAAVDNVTRSLGRALAPHVRVVSVSPGLVDTPFVDSLDRVWRDEQESRTPLGRLAAPADVGAAVLAAVRDLTFMTGAVLAVDGGRPLS